MATAGIVAFATIGSADHTSGGIGGGTAAPIATESGSTLPRGKLVVGLKAEWIDFDEFSDRELEDLRARDAEADLHSVGSILGASANVHYGVTDDLTVGLKIPYVRRSDIREPAHGHGHDHDHGHGHGIEDLGDSTGLGDVTAFGQYRFFRDPDTHHASLILGVKAPTGEGDERSEEGRLETELQPGSGSWDGLFGLAYTHLFAPFSLDASVLYTLVTEGDQDSDLGDILNYNLALSYRLGGREAGPFYAPGASHSWDLVLELNGEWRDEEETAGVEDGNSGGNIVYLSPGVRFNSRWNWGVAASLGIPVLEDLNGDQVEPDVRLIGSFSIGF